MGEAFLCGGWLFHLVSDGPLFQLLGKVGRRRHVLYAKVLLAESHPSEIKTKTTPEAKKRPTKNRRVILTRLFLTSSLS
jgi:hypothetical protein